MIGFEALPPDVLHPPSRRTNELEMGAAAAPEALGPPELTDDQVWTRIEENDREIRRLQLDNAACHELLRRRQENK